MRVACLLLTGDHKYIFPSLSLKIVPNRTIDMKNSIGVGGEAGDVRHGRRCAENRSGNDLPWRVPHRRIQLARERQVNVRMVPTSQAIEVTDTRETHGRTTSQRFL